MNRHPLTADFDMYYRGTFVFRNGPKGFQAMMVDSTTRDGDDTQPAGVRLHGNVYSTDADQGGGVWRGDELIPFRPVSGYFDLKNTGNRSIFMSYTVSNRTQRKGFDSRTCVAGGGPWTPNGVQVARLFEQSQGLDSRPGHRDLYIQETRDGKRVHWKGVHVGSLNGEGKFSPLEQFKKFEEIVCRLLQNI